MLAVLLALTAVLALSSLPHVAHEAWAADDSETELAKKTQNPVADLISVPFQSNFNFNTGTKEEMVYVLNVQPVIPIKLTDDLNLITRTIMPIINQPSLFPQMESAFGMGDINPTLFFSPSKPRPFIWGAGPTFTFPTATDRLLGAGKYSLGPAAVALMMDGPWVVGALINQQWSVAGWGHKDVNAMLIQPFINYNLPHGWYLTSSPIITGDWTARASDQWTVPVGGGAGKLFRLGKLPINTSLAGYYNATGRRTLPSGSCAFRSSSSFRSKPDLHRTVARPGEACAEHGDRARFAEHEEQRDGEHHQRARGCSHDQPAKQMTVQV